MPVDGSRTSPPLRTTARLDLRVFHPRDLLTLIDEPQQFAERFGCPAAAGLRDFFVSGDLSPTFLAHLRAAPAADPWSFGFALVHRDRRQVIGSASFKGPPDNDGIVEIAYAVVPSFERQGYATEAAAALVAFASEDERVRIVRAHTLPQANASTAVLRKCGFVHLGEVVDPEDGRVWRWERARSAPREPMYSTEWFETFAATVPASLNAADLDGIAAILPRADHARLLDIGCGIGRIAGPLSARGYAVTGIDVSLEALRVARRNHPAVRYVGLDQRHIGQLRWVFDGALFLWNSLGFVGRAADLETLAGVARVLRPGGTVVFDMYHPDWLEQNQRAGEPDARGAAVRRWLRDGRSCHQIHYSSGRVDDIQFNVYRPEEIGELSRRAGLRPEAAMVGWKPAVQPSPEFPRYQVVCARPG